MPDHSQIGGRSVQPLLDAPPDAASSPSLDALRSRIDAAVHEIEQLRRQNARLRRRIDELEKRPEIDPKDTFVTFDESPSEMRTQIEGFIQAIDEYLGEEES